MDLDVNTHYVYRFIDDGGGDVYIGYSSNIIQRMGHHLSYNKEIINSISDESIVKLYPFKQAEHATLYESVMISKFKPKFNVKDKGRYFDFDMIADKEFSVSVKDFKKLGYDNSKYDVH